MNATLTAHRSGLKKAFTTPSTGGPLLSGTQKLKGGSTGGIVPWKMDWPNSDTCAVIDEQPKAQVPVTSSPTPMPNRALAF